MIKSVEIKNDLQVLNENLKKIKNLYEKPRIEKQTKMDFPLKILKLSYGINCRQCSSCHGCR